MANSPYPSDVESLDLLRKAGWSIGDAAFLDGRGGIVWRVSGSDGEDLIRDDDATRDEASASPKRKPKGDG